MLADSAQEDHRFHTLQYRRGGPTEAKPTAPLFPPEHSSTDSRAHTVAVLLLGAVFF